MVKKSTICSWLNQPFINGFTILIKKKNTGVVLTWEKRVHRIRICFQAAGTLKARRAAKPASLLATAKFHRFFFGVGKPWKIDGKAMAKGCKNG